MARSRDEQGSLFPFLSVLSCVIGTLALLIAALAFSQIAGDLGRAANDPALPDGNTAGDAPSLDEQSERALDLAEAELEGARAELRALGLDPDSPPESRSAEIEARLALLELRSIVPGLDERASALRARRTGLESLVPKAMQPRGDDAGIALLPSGSGASLRPTFVECREGAVRFHDVDTGESRALDLSDPLHLGRFNREMQRVRADRSGTVVFLIRPDGVATYEKAVRNAGFAHVRHAKLPLPGFGPLDFSAL